jgi:peptidyl-prolyl cis-trans isomerase C
MSPSRALVAAGLLLSTTIGAAAYLRSRSSDETSGPSVATVGDAPVSARDLDLRVSELLPMASFHGNIAPERMRALRRTALDELILDELIWQESRRQGKRPDEAAVDAEVGKVRARFESDEAYEAALAESRLTPREFRRYMQRAVLVRDARAAHVPADPSEADLRTYFEGNRAKFVRPEQVNLLEIQVKVDPAGGKTAEREAQKKTDRIAKKLRAGADFRSLAWEESEDAYRVKSGELGWVHRGRLDPDLETAVFAAPVGEVGVVRSLAGFHLFQVLERQPSRQLEFDEARDLLMDRLRRERRAEAARQWEDGLRRSVRIEILDAGLKDATPMEIRPSGAADGGPQDGVPAANPAP